MDPDGSAERQSARRFSGTFGQSQPPLDYAVMKWLLLMGAVAFGAFAVWWLARGRPGRPVRSRTLAEGALAILSLVLIVAAAYVAHGMGIFSLPLVALAFLPFGVATRWLLVSTRPAGAGRWTAERRLPDPGSDLLCR